MHLHGTPPGAQPRRRAQDDAPHVPDEVDRIIVALCQRIDELAYGIEAIRALIDDSEGVAGLHLNGDLAPWSELQSGGRFEEWLQPFNDAESAAQKPIDYRTEEARWADMRARLLTKGQP